MLKIDIKGVSTFAERQFIPPVMIIIGLQRHVGMLAGGAIPAHQRMPAGQVNVFRLGNQCLRCGLMNKTGSLSGFAAVILSLERDFVVAVDVLVCP